MPRDLKEAAGWRFSSLRKMRLGRLGQRNGGGLWRLKGTYHPAALERAADSIKGVETQGLGISLPMIESAFVSLRLRTTLFERGRVVVGSSRIVVVSKGEGRREGQDFVWYLTEHCQMCELKFSHHGVLVDGKDWSLSLESG